MEAIKQFDNIVIGSNINTDLFKGTPVFEILEKKKLACQKYFKHRNKEEEKLLLELIAYCDFKLKKYFGL